MSQQVAVRLDEEQLAVLDAAVKRGAYQNRAQAIRVALDRMLREVREDEIDRAYRKAYAKDPQEDWVGEIGLAALTAFFEEEESSKANE